MSFSPFDVLMGMAESEEEPTVGSSFSVASMNPTNETQTSGERMSSQSSVGIESFDDTMTFDSSTLQDFGSIVSLPAGTIAGILRSQFEEDRRHAEDGTYEGQTIVSSEPSGVFIPPPEASRDSWAISPHPGFVADSTLSLSTHCTESVTIPDAQGTRQPPPTYHNEDDSLNSDNSTNQNSNGNKELLNIVEPPTKLLPIPPEPLKTHITEVSFQGDSSYSAEDYLPENFICKICKDVIVGALSLNCGCESSTVCSSCWESKHSSPPEFGGHQDMTTEKLGYVWVDRQISPTCPSCSTAVKSSMNCHPLDIAIFQIILNLPVKDNKTRSLKSSYFSRLEAWRCIVIERNERRTRDEAIRQDELLARILQEEETFFEGCKSKTRAADQTGSLFFWGQAAVALAVALAVATILPRAKNRR